MSSKQEGSKSGAFARAHCRCGSEIRFAREHVNRSQKCPKCGLEFHVKIVKDSRGREQTIVTFSTRKMPTVKPPAKPEVRVTQVGPLAPERPKEQSRDGRFILDMTSETGAGPHAKKRAPVPEEPFEKATFSLAPIPYTTKRETIPGKIYSTCGACGEGVFVRKQDLGQRVRCGACRRTLQVETSRDPQTRDLVIRLKPV
ncbi:MAG: hypothetical protein HYY16_01445 [Planctomycetes bacterium]|nr:hypothetical protein [Planctomycetota bacterium]